MKAASTLYVEAPAPALPQARAADYLELVRPRVALLVLFTVAAGACLAAGTLPDPLLLWHALCGTALVAAGASALNQLLERHTDALMRRTENRPLPAGRMLPGEVLVFGVGLAGIGLAYLAFALPSPLAALVAGFTLISYVALYTPLKRRTPLNTLVGAVPGALPPVIGWAAVRGTVGHEALALFLIVFLWQVPHFLAIAWIYRRQYAVAGLRMLPATDPDGSQTGRHMVRYCLVLIPASLVPASLGLAGPVYLVGAVILGSGFLRCTLGFQRARREAGPLLEARARRVLRASLVYLPALFLLLLLDALAAPVVGALQP